MLPMLWETVYRDPTKRGTVATSWYRAADGGRRIHRAMSLCLIVAVVGLISGCAGRGATSDEDNSAEQAQADSEGSPDEDGGSAEK